MDKLQSSSPRPLWERQKSDRGHKSSVNKALEAHRQRRSERMARTEARLQTARDITNSFFPKPQVNTVQPSLSLQPQVQDQFIDQGQVDIVQVQPNQPRPLDMIYEDAQLQPISEQAMTVVEKDVLDATSDDSYEDVPKGSYVDYRV